MPLVYNFALYRSALNENVDLAANQPEIPGSGISLFAYLRSLNFYSWLSARILTEKAQVREFITQIRSSFTIYISVEI
jgi:hypothetical protein